MQTTLKYLLLSFIIVLTLASFTNVSAQNSNDKFVIVLDAGHGGKDPGRPTKFEKEKNVALKIVLEIGKQLEKHDDIEVIYTRKKDVFLELRERANIANKADADLFVSIHCNAHNTQAYGTETYVLSVGNTDRNFDVAKAENEVIFLEDDYEKHYEGYDPNSPESLIGLSILQEDYTDQSILLATLVEGNFKTRLKRKSRGVKQQPLWVMHNTYMPSVLIEAGFLTNKDEGKYLSSKKGQTEISKAIADAILKYKSEVAPTFEVLEKQTENTTSDKESDIYPDVTFKVQIAASSKLLETKPYNFNGLVGVSREKNDGLYKYYYGSTSDYNEIKSKQSEAIKKGYSTSFIIALKNGERVPLDEVLKTTPN